ncbi:MAG: restriction endonuclease fold toxin 5 domain-containing protein [Prevotella sp.]|jgi:hypothetical protein|nr:restriction endonuclease fold toxin 5 domain-containing protein [Prevotella sp.]
MGNKIITEDDFFQCSGGMLPSPFQSRQSIVKKADSAKYITKMDISTVSWVDFGCKKLMLLYAVVAAVAALVAALCVATGGAALIAICAIAGAAGAIFGAVVGSLICGQLVAPTRQWIGSKSNFQILGIDTITGDHFMRCDAFVMLGMNPEFITFAPNIKSWGQAIALGAANFIGKVFEGMMAGALIGTAGAAFSGLVGAGAAGGWSGVGRVVLQFVKSIPKNFIGNIVESFSAFGLGMRGVMSAQNVLATYGETGEMSAETFNQSVKDGFWSMETGAIESVTSVCSGQGTWQDIGGIVLMFSPVGKGKRDLEDGLSGKADDMANRADDADGRTKDGDEITAKRQTDAETSSKKEDGDAYEMGSTSKKPSYQHGQSDGGPGTWEHRTTPDKNGSAAYQEKVTGSPKDTEYVVTTDKMSSGEKKFDGYDPETNTLIDAKKWDDFPPEGQKWAEDKIVKEARNDAEIAGEAGCDLEWHVPTKERATQLEKIFRKNKIEGIDVKVTPK